MFFFFNRFFLKRFLDLKLHFRSTKMLSKGWWKWVVEKMANQFYYLLPTNMTLLNHIFWIYINASQFKPLLPLSQAVLNWWWPWSHGLYIMFLHRFFNSFSQAKCQKIYLTLCSVTYPLRCTVVTSDSEMDRKRKAREQKRTCFHRHVEDVRKEGRRKRQKTDFCTMVILYTIWCK